MLVAAVSAGTGESGGRCDAAEPSPEARRLDEQAFRDGLRRRGLTELLQFGLSEARPDDEVEARLMRHEVLLAVFDDRARPEDERQTALAEANEILRALIAERPTEPRSLDWRLDLAQTLLYRAGEPYSSSVLYRGGTAAERVELARIMDQALEVFDALLAALEIEYQRLDQLGLGPYERLEREGYIEKVEGMRPQAQAMRRWAAFYRAIARGPEDPRRVAELRGVADELRTGTELLTTPHETTHYQSQSLLLSGMALARTGEGVSALRHLEEAIQVAEQLADPVERRGLQWAVTLARLERVRVLRDLARYEAALRELDGLRAWVGSTAPRNFGLQLVVANLEASISRGRAVRARAAGQVGLAQRLSSRAMDPLITLAQRNDAYRDAVYAALYESMDPQQPVEDLHPFERCALIAGLIADAAQTAGAGASDRAEQYLARAMTVAEDLLGDAGEIAPGVEAEVWYNLGVARHRRGLRFEAAQAFLAAGRDYPGFLLAERAATLAVQTAWEVYQDAGLRQRSAVQNVYREALAALIDAYPDSAAAKYWRFFRAQLLEDLGRFDDAAGQYLQVESDHELYISAQYRHARCLAQRTRELAEQPDVDPVEVVRAATAAISAARRFIEPPAGSDADSAAAPSNRLLAGAVMNLAEICVLPGVDRYDEALQATEGFEQRHPDSADYLGRVLRVRVIAYQALGRLAEAEQAIPKYIRTDPEHAGVTLQGLFESLRHDIDRLRRAGRADRAQAKAESALVLARQIDDWARGPDSGVSVHDRYALRVQLAEAYLTVDRPEPAERLFAELLAEAEAGRQDSGGDARVVFGLAESRVRLNRHQDALPLFNRLYRRTDQGTTLWWNALLGDLRCRTALGQDPAGVVRVIRQHRFLHPEMGGDELRGKFDALMLQNQAISGTPD